MSLLLVPGQAEGKCKSSSAVLLSELIYCTSKSITNNRATEAKEHCRAGIYSNQKAQNLNSQEKKKLQIAA